MGSVMNPGFVIPGSRDPKNKVTDPNPSIKELRVKTLFEND